jgi:hypothetical protein
MRSAVDEATARALIKAVLSLDGAIGQIDTVVTGMTDLVEKRVWIQKVGDSFAFRTRDLFSRSSASFPIWIGVQPEITQHPLSRGTTNASSTGEGRRALKPDGR